MQTLKVEVTTSHIIITSTIKTEQSNCECDYEQECTCNAMPTVVIDVTRLVMSHIEYLSIAHYIELNDIFSKTVETYYTNSRFLILSHWFGYTSIFISDLLNEDGIRFIRTEWHMVKQLVETGLKAVNGELKYTAGKNYMGVSQSIPIKWREIE